jgi:hypothetical protein
LPAEIGTIFLIKWSNAVPAAMREVSTWLGWMWNAGIIMLLSFGLSPGSQGRGVNDIEALFHWRFESFRNETEERPDFDRTEKFPYQGYMAIILAYHFADNVSRLKQLGRHSYDIDVRTVWQVARLQ